MCVYDNKSKSLFTPQGETIDYISNQITSHFIGHIDIFSRCYCGRIEMLVFLAPTAQLYLTV